MSTAELEILGALIGFVFAGGFSLIGLRMFLTYRARRLGGGVGEEVEQLAEAVEELRRDLVETRAELADVHERVDFAERLLARARDSGRDQGGA